MLTDVLRFAAPKQPWRMRLTGHSMSPTIRDGDEMLVDPALEPRLGDVVVFTYDEKLVAHRIIKFTRPYITAGDASRGMREQVAREDIIGTVREVRRAGRLVHMDSRSVAKALWLRGRLAIAYHLRVTR